MLFSRNRRDVGSMSVQHTEAVITAACTVHEEVWNKYWKNGMTELEPARVISSILKVRATAQVSEDDLPPELLSLLKEARYSAPDQRKIKLSRLIMALGDVFRPPSSEKA
jgi:hypothetical protein